jgi:hypothetical protein
VTCRISFQFQTLYLLKDFRPARIQLCKLLLGSG